MAPISVAPPAGTLKLLAVRTFPASAQPAVGRQRVPFRVGSMPVMVSPAGRVSLTCVTFIATVLAGLLIRSR